ncbi:MAG: hypothetical protein Q9177_002605 [Variospora cf. flavescens]
MAAHSCPFWMVTTAEVIETYRDGDEYGNTDSDWLTLSLKISTWSPDHTLLARMRHSKKDDDDNKPQPVHKGKKYRFEGGFYFAVAQQNWHRAYLNIEFHEEVPESEYTDARDPFFEVVCKVLRVVDEEKMVLCWQSWDDYEPASYGQTTIVSGKEAVPHVRDNLDKVWKISGRMVALDDLQARSLGYMM